MLRKDLEDVGVRLGVNEARNIVFLAERKFNRYDLYAPGETFQQKLVEWLGNFETADRQTALTIVEELHFVNQTEMRALAAATLQNIVSSTGEGVTHVARASAAAYFQTLSQKTEKAVAESLFIAMADDVLFDFFRRNAQRTFPVLGRGNFVEYYKLDPEAISDLADYSQVYLLDQISGSGTSFLRPDAGGWKGKLPTFCAIWEKTLGKSKAKITYCPYLMSTVASQNLSMRLAAWPRPDCVSHPVATLSTQIVKVANCLSSDGGFSVDEKKPVSLLCAKYYNRFREDRHTLVGGGCKYGFGKAGLILVLFTNCPNDSIYLVWHDNDGWTPLFPRVSHHRGEA